MIKFGTRLITEVNSTIMEQYIGDGANLFITIVACLAAFGAAIGALDFMKGKKEDPKG